MLWAMQNDEAGCFAKNARNDSSIK